MTGFASWDGRDGFVMLTASLGLTFGDYAVGTTWGLYARAVQIGSDGSIQTQGAFTYIDTDTSQAAALTALNGTQALAICQPGPDTAMHGFVLTVDPATLDVTAGPDTVIVATPYETVTGPDGLYQGLKHSRDYPLACHAISPTEVVIGYELDHSKVESFEDNPAPAAGEEIEYRALLVTISGTTITPGAPINVLGPAKTGVAGPGPTSGTAPSGATATPKNDGYSSYLDGGVQYFFAGGWPPFWIREMAQLDSTTIGWLLFLPSTNLESDGWGSLYLAVLDVSGVALTVAHLWRVSRGRLYYWATDVSGSPSYVDATYDGVDGSMPLGLSVSNGYFVVAFNFNTTSNGSGIAASSNLIPFTGAESSPSVDPYGEQLHLVAVDPATGAVTSDLQVGSGGANGGGAPLLAPMPDGTVMVGVNLFTAGPGDLANSFRYVSVDGSGSLSLDTPLDVSTVGASRFWYDQIAAIPAANAVLMQDNDDAVYYTVGDFTPPLPAQPPDFDTSAYQVQTRPQVWLRPKIHRPAGGG